jgi:adenylate cyclase
MSLSDRLSTVENLSDSEMLRFYGDIMTILTQRITDEQGILDKYIGDAVMAFWNMPRAVADHETKAVRAALACRTAIPALADKGWPIDFRIGINTATCQVGNFGSWDRLNYTAIGDGVNVASRLEALCKAYHCPILISATTHEKLPSDTFVTRLVDKVAVKGKGGGWAYGAVACLNFFTRRFYHLSSLCPLCRTLHVSPCHSLAHF